ncbi:MAG: adenylate/guanylate cyclase domain-containing protein [Longimicrobiales bacterium]
MSALAIALTLLLRATTAMEVAEAKSYDLRAGWLADPAEADSSIVIITIDENSLDVYGDEYGRWPWPREPLGYLLRYAAVGGARAVVFDIQFPEPDRYAEGDTILAEDMVRAGNAVIAFTVTPGDSAAAEEWEQTLLSEDTTGLRAEARRYVEESAVGRVGEGFPGSVLPDFPYAEAPYPLFGGTAAGLGVVNWTPGPDGVTRAQPLLVEHRGALYPSLAMAAARLLEPERYGGEPRWEAGDLRFGDHRIPVLEDGRVIIDWHGPYLREGRETYETFPAYSILNSWKAVFTGHSPPVPADTFDGKVVFIAATAAGAFEARATPLAPHDPGVMIHAALLDNLLNGDFIRRAGWPANVGLLALTVLLATMLAVVFESAWVGVLGTAAVLLAAGGASTWALAGGVWLDMAAPLFGGALAFAGAYVGNYLTEGREKDRVRDLFSRYVSPEYVSQLADDYENVKLGGERIPVTLLFSDIRGFTSLSERLDPETVIEMLNDYLDRMAEVVFRYGGTLDKFIGDAVMAFWNAPVRMDDHPVRAVEAALDMLEELETLNQRWKDTDAPAQLAIGIGINTGEAIVGNIGSLERKLDYTAIGDTVNLASRLEGLNKEYGSSIIVSEGTKRELPEDTYELRPIDEVKVKGKDKAVQIFELQGRKAGRPEAGSRPTGQASSLATTVLLAALAALSTSPAAAQDSEKARWTDWVYRPGEWRNGTLVEEATTDVNTASLALVSKVDVYAIAPRWRAEFRDVASPDSVAPPLVLIVEGDRAVVLTELGSTALEEHRAADDPLVRTIMAHVEGGRPSPPGPVRFTEVAEDGELQYVVIRRPAARAEFSDGLLSTSTMGRLGRSVARLGVNAIGGERDQEVVASAGARGVAKVQTADGEIEVMPDTAAIMRMQEVVIGVVDLDQFLRDAGITPVPLETPRQEEGV